MAAFPRLTAHRLFLLVGVSVLILALSIPLLHYGKLSREYRILAETAARDAESDLKYVDYWKTKSL
jgi:hypothetical protein